MLLIAVLVTSAAGRPALASNGASTQPPLFGFSEQRSSTLSLFPKWRGALSRYFDESKLANSSCTSTVFTRCHLQEWKRFLDGIRGADQMAQIRAVNQFLNRRQYIVDPRNYGVPDYWATPGQFLSKDGDCEDYAIAKYFSLRNPRYCRPRDLRGGAARARLEWRIHPTALVRFQRTAILDALVVPKMARCSVALFR